MDKLLITGGVPLSGTISISGAKNAVLPILAATLLTDQCVVLNNVPNLQDVSTMMTLLSRMGVQVTTGQKNQLIVNNRLNNSV